MLFTSKNKKFPWERKHNKAFEKLKEELSSETMPAFYEPNKDFQLFTDACNHAVDGVSQKDYKKILTKL